MCGNTLKEARGFNEDSFFALSVYGTSLVSVRCGSIMHYISAPERERLQKNETNHIVRPRLLLSESIVRPSCIGWGNCVKRRGVSPTARRQWMPACLSSCGRASRRNMAINTVLNRWSAPWYMRFFCAKTFDKAFKKAVMTVKAWRCHGGVVEDSSLLGCDAWP